MPTIEDQGLRFISYSDVAQGATLAFPFRVLEPEHIVVSFDTEVQRLAIDYSVNSVSQTITLLGAEAPASSVRVKIFSRTRVDDRLVDYTDGSSNSAFINNLDSNQLFFLIQELMDARGITVVPGAGGGNGSVDIPVGDPDDPITPGVPLDPNTALVIVNGIYVSPQNYTIDMEANSITFDPPLEVGDTVSIRVLQGASISNIDVGAVTTDGLADNAVTEPKIANNSLVWRHNKTGGAVNWSSPADATGLAEFFLNLHQRLAAVEAGPPTSPTNIELPTSGRRGLENTGSISFNFLAAPDFVMLTRDAQPGENPVYNGASFIVSPGTTAHLLPASPGTLNFSTTLSGNTLTVTRNSGFTITSPMFFNAVGFINTVPFIED